MNQDLKQYIDQLAQSLGVAANHVYDVIVKQTVIEGIIWTIIQTSLAIALPFLIIKLMKSFKKREFDTSLDFGIGMTMLILIIFSGLFWIISIGSLPDSVMSIVNPEYYAIKEILESVKP